MEPKQVFIKVFQYIYRKALSFQDYTFTPTENQHKQLDNFITYLGKQVDINSVGLNWVYDFVLWGVREKVVNNRLYKGSIPMNWVIGRRAYENFINKPKDHWAYFNKKFANEKGVKFEELQEPVEVDTCDYYDLIRKENYNKQTPIIYCYHTTPHKKLSKYCMRCADKGVCKEINFI